MPLEIERRWLIEDDIKERLDAIDPYDQEKIEQSYLVDTGGWVSRIRLVKKKDGDDRFYLTMKRPAGGFANHEIETFISRKAFREFEAHTGPTIIKQRYYIQHDGLLIELDVYRNFKFIGLIIAEVELPAEDTPFTPPDWFGREITGDRVYSNYALAKHLTDDKTELPYFPTPPQPVEAVWHKNGVPMTPRGDWPMTPRKVAPR